MNRQEAQKLLDEKHFENPSIGDFWHEMFCPYFIVLDIVKDKYWICDKRHAVDKDYWTWDLKKSRIVDKSYFDKVKYNDISGFVANVIVNENNPFVEEFKKIKPTLIDSYDNSPIIEQLKEQRKYWINKYINLIIEELVETVPDTNIKYIDIIKEENPHLISKLQKLL